MFRVFSAPPRWHRAVAAALFCFLSVPAAGHAVDLHVAGLTVTQATQTDDQSVPLIADRRAHVRVFVLADGENQARPKVRLQFFYGRKARHQTIVSAPGGLAGVPIELARHDHAKSWNVTVPAGWIQPGLKLVAEVDPDRRVRESNEGNNRWPSRSGQAIDVRKARPWKLTLVPIRLPDGRTSEATTSNIESYVSFARRLYPVPEKLDVVVHGVFTTDTYVEYPSEFTRLVHQIDALRLLERTPERYYAGLINPAFTTIAGMGWIPGKASVSAEYPLLVEFGRLSVRESIFAHELGHNLGLSHTPCGGAVGPDRNYPYLDGKIGRPGYDVFVSRAYAPDRAGDIMSYCATESWISDYHYLKVLSHRERVADALVAEAARAVNEEVESLLV
ncbi:MAG: M66 family metalloprotease, partial [Thermoanaerobaculia bacterium]|nr:M66 family metalloprotease [Thermoanaerobaculia bacterium]